MLSDLGFKHVTGVDMSDDAIRFCAGKGLGHVEKGNVCSLPFDNVSFDVVLATDIIEHVDDDDRALAEIAGVLRPGGKVLIKVPAFRSLWGLQDEVAFHKRRYRMLPLLGQLKPVGLAPPRRYYFELYIVRSDLAGASAHPHFPCPPRQRGRNQYTCLEPHSRRYLFAGYTYCPNVSGTLWCLDTGYGGSRYKRIAVTCPGT
jgi:SAM-dependent methyltransferase